MSLAAIRELRMARQKPSAVLSVVIGEAPKSWKDDPSLIELRAGCEPRLMDWRPVVGLWAAFYLIRPDWTLLDGAVECCEKAGAKIFGFVHAGKAHPLIALTDDPTLQQQAAASLRNTWETLCR